MMMDFEASVESRRTARSLSHGFYLIIQGALKQLGARANPERVIV